MALKLTNGRTRRRTAPAVGLAFVLGALVLVAPGTATATASGEWVGTLKFKFTRTEVGPSFIGFGPDITFWVTGPASDPVVDQVTYAAGFEEDFGLDNACHKHMEEALTDHGGGQFTVGLTEPTTLLLQGELSNYSTVRTEVITGPDTLCANMTVQTPQFYGALTRHALVTLIDADQEAASGTVTLRDETSGDGGIHWSETLTYAVHRNCTGFDADGDGVGDCAELDAETDPSVPDGPPVDCEGPITVDDVIGPDPALAAGRVFPEFPNDDAICYGVWVPGLDQGFVPQGLALVGDGTALVSGYLDQNDDTLRIALVRLSDGAQLAFDETTNGGHGGGITIDASGRVWVVSTNKVWMWTSVAAVFVADPTKLAKASGQTFALSYIADSTDVANLWFGSFKSNELLQFPLTTLLGKVGTEQKLMLTDATTTIGTGTKTQGGEFHDPNLWTSSSITATKLPVGKAKCGTLQTGLATRTRYGWAPGVEEITFGDNGFLWMISEAGAAGYTPQFFPVIAQADTSLITDAPPSGCKTGI